MISIWSLVDKKLVARGEGHTSWVSRVAFDEWHCLNGMYRFGSVGEDCLLNLWEFEDTHQVVLCFL